MQIAPNMLSPEMLALAGASRSTRIGPGPANPGGRPTGQRHKQRPGWMKPGTVQGGVRRRMARQGKG